VPRGYQPSYGAYNYYYYYPYMQPPMSEAEAQPDNYYSVRMNSKNELGVLISSKARRTIL
jgi:hypothetical protein